MRYRIKATAVVRDGMLFEESVPICFEIECPSDFEAYFKAHGIIKTASVMWRNIEITDRNGEAIGFLKFRK